MRIYNFNLRYIAILMFFSSLIGCSKKYKLTESDLKLQPYQVGDVLIFETNNKTIDTISITELDYHSNPNDQLSLTSDLNETLFVNGYMSIPNEKSKRNILTLLEITSSKRSYIRFKLDKKYDKLYYPDVLLYLNDFSEKFNNESENVFSGIDDIIEIEGSDMSGLHSDVKSILWSKKFGYIKYNYKDQTYWELKKFIRDGKNLLENK